MHRQGMKVDIQPMGCLGRNGAGRSANEMHRQEWSLQAELGVYSPAFGLLKIILMMTALAS